MPRNQYFSDGDITSTNSSTASYTASGNYRDQLIEFVTSVESKNSGKINARLYFKWIKGKFGVLEEMRLKRRIKKLEAAFNKAIDNGQISLGEKLMAELTRETREAVMYAKGIRHFIEREDLHKHKRNIRGGHISDTVFEKYTRIVPDKIIEKKKKFEPIFDGFIIYHYYNENEEKIREKNQKMSSDEKAAMRDPVLFGIIRESDRLYYIDEWDDEFCDLSFDEIVDVIAKEEKMEDEEFELGSDKPYLGEEV